MSMAISTASMWATVLSLTFPALVRGVGQMGTFGLYAVGNVVAWVLCWAFVREVKGVGLEEMDAMFESAAWVFVRERWEQGVCGERGRRKEVGKGWVEVRQEDADE